MVGGGATIVWLSLLFDWILFVSLEFVAFSLPNPYVDEISLLLLVGDTHRLELLAVFVLSLLTPKISNRENIFYFQILLIKND